MIFTRENINSYLDKTFKGLLSGALYKIITNHNVYFWFNINLGQIQGTVFFHYDYTGYVLYDYKFKFIYNRKNVEQFDLQSNPIFA